MTTPPSPQILELLSRIEAKTVRASSDGRVTQQIGPFLAVAHPSSELIWLSYAIPLSAQRDGADVAAAVPELRKWFAARNRRLRLEILEPLWPELAPQLMACGLNLQGRMPIMFCAPGQLKPVPAPPGVTLSSVSPSADDAELAAFITLGLRAFAMEPRQPGPQEIAENRDNLARGRYRSAVARLDGAPVAVGSMSVANDELVGIAVLPEYRGRGIGAAISYYLVNEHFARGAAFTWLSAGDEPARRVYDRIGFTAVGDQVNMAEPA